MLIANAQKKNLFSKTINFRNKSKGEETCDGDLKKDVKLVLEDNSLYTKMKKTKKLKQQQTTKN